jgi:zinc transport system ATP-binding protein
MGNGAGSQPRIEPGKGDDPLEPPKGQTVLTAADLSVELGGLPVLRGITMSVRPGEAVALLGGNGSGKTTLVRALLGLIPLQRGTVQLFGVPLSRFREWSRIGYMPQRSAAGLSGAKVKEVVAAGRLSRRPPFVPPRPDDRAAVARALATVGLTERASDRLSELSAGQQQRVLLARALAGQPEMLVLDEPTAGVDLASQGALTETLSELVRRGTALVIVLHEVGWLAGLLDRGVVLREGRIAYDGPISELSRTVDHRHHPEELEPGWLDGAIER